jgi:hypothetical protein
LVKNDFTNQIENQQISNFILEEQLKINNSYDIVFEWIPYDQFDYIKEVRKGFATAVWKNGSLEYNSQSKKYERKLNEKVVLKYLYNLNDNSHEYLSKVRLN